MKSIILWGTGKIASRMLGLINEKIIMVVDNDEQKWGKVWNGYVINKPSNIIELKERFDKIVIACSDWEAVWEQIANEFFIDSSLIDNVYYRQKAALINSYDGERENDKKKYISFLKQNPLSVYNSDFQNKYEARDVEVYFDKNKSLYYVYYNNKKMYFSKKFIKKEHVKSYYNFICMEQDVMSPHRYQTEKFYVCQGDVVLDAGVAEGNFALDIIDIVDKVYLVEADKDWIEALRCTFEPYKDKVEIIEGFLGSDAQKDITVDLLVSGKNINFIKMDIEGAEIGALRGAKKTLEENNIKVDICAYHNAEDEEQIKELLRQAGYEAEVSDGYMVFMTKINPYEKEVTCPRFVRGLVRGYRK